MQIFPLHPRWKDLCGFILTFLEASPELPAKAAIHENYLHGGGWRKFKGFTYDPDTKILQYPEDPPYKPVVEIHRDDEVILIYPYAWVLVLQPDGSYEVARID